MKNHKPNIAYLSITKKGNINVLLDLSTFKGFLIYLEKDKDNEEILLAESKGKLLLNHLKTLVDPVTFHEDLEKNPYVELSEEIKPIMDKCTLPQSEIDAKARHIYILKTVNYLTSYYNLK